MGQWFKMHWPETAFLGTSENAVELQIWIAVSVYGLVAIIKKRLNLSRSLPEMLQIVSAPSFGKARLDIALSGLPITPETDQDRNQLMLLLKTLGQT